MNNKKLFIEIYKEGEHLEPRDVKFENLEYYYDFCSGVGVQKKYIEDDLKVGCVYAFTYEDYDDIDTYYYTILKREGNIYYIAEYYGGKLYRYKEERLSHQWIKCNVKKQFGIDVENFVIKPHHINMYWVSTIIFDEGDTKPWLCAIDTVQDTLEQAMYQLEFTRKHHNVLSGWIDVFDENDNKQTVFHECYMR